MSVFLLTMFGRQFACWLLLGTGWLLLAGCDDGRPHRVPVSGQVLIDGEPVTCGYIRFVPDGARPSGGDIDSNGRFTLTCYDGGDGAVPGLHRIEVAARQPIQGGAAVRWLAPKKYLDVQTSGLTQKITEATDSVVVELTWDGGEPFVEH